MHCLKQNKQQNVYFSYILLAHACQEAEFFMLGKAGTWYIQDLRTDAEINLNVNSKFHQIPNCSQ